MCVSVVVFQQKNPIFRTGIQNGVRNSNRKLGYSHATNMIKQISALNVCQCAGGTVRVYESFVNEWAVAVAMCQIKTMLKDATHGVQNKEGSEKSNNFLKCFLKRRKSRNLCVLFLFVSDNE